MRHLIDLLTEANHVKLSATTVPVGRYGNTLPAFKIDGGVSDLSFGTFGPWAVQQLMHLLENQETELTGQDLEEITSLPENCVELRLGQDEDCMNGTPFLAGRQHVNCTALKGLARQRLTEKT